MKIPVINDSGIILNESDAMPMYIYPKSINPNYFELFGG